MADKNDEESRLPVLIACLITVIWTVSFIVDLLNPKYDPPPTVGALMLLAAGWLFGKGIMPGLKNGKKESSDRGS
jgi:hypothetical protein